MTKEFIEVLLTVQAKMPVIVKTESGYQDRYQYAPIDIIWKEVEELLQSNGFVIINEISAEGVKTRAIHALGELTSTIPFSNLELKPQDRGSEITYYRRYNLTSIFNIMVVGEDDDASVTNKPEEKPAVASKSTSGSSLGVCSSCGAPKITYKSGKIGCSKYCWMNKTPKSNEDQLGGA